MAWIVKDSAKQSIERREQAYLTDAMKKHFTEEILPRYATKQAALLPVCHETQHHYGFLPHQVLEEIAQLLELSTAEVIDTVTFYEEFRLKPAGKHLIQVCRSISCELCGQRDLSDKLKAKLGVLPGETTDDGKFTFLELECLGACGGAPAVLLNEDLHETLTWEKLEALIEALPG